MNKLSQKFIAGMVVILVVSGLCVIALNKGFLETYYLAQKKETLQDIGKELEERIRRGDSANTAIDAMEEASKVIVAHMDARQDMSDEKVNEQIRIALQDKGIGFQTYWLWEEDLNKILGGETRTRLYRQEKFSYSLLVEYTYVKEGLFAVVMIIPDISDAFGVIHSFLIIVNLGAILLMIFFVVILVRNITRPLKQFEEFATHMGKGEFMRLEVYTKDELEDVANHLNAMGSEVVAHQKMLSEKNQQMEQLLGDVAHDLKTPVSLIRLYSEGIKDNMDDGTFLETIGQQSEQMQQMIDRLLLLAQIDHEDLIYEPCNISILMKEILEEYGILAKEQELKVSQQIEESIIITTHKAWMQTIFSNLITNAIKYAATPELRVTLQSDANHITIATANHTDNKTLDIKNIWNPYYVGEPSRNKHLSGTGLGLSIVKKMCFKLGYEVMCTLEEGRITITVKIPTEETNYR